MSKLPGSIDALLSLREGENLTLLLKLLNGVLPQLALGVRSPYNYMGNLTLTDKLFTTGLTRIVVAKQNASRRLLIFGAPGTSDIFLSIDPSVAGNTGLPLRSSMPPQLWDYDRYGVTVTREWTAGSAAASSVYVAEGILTPTAEGVVL